MLTKLRDGSRPVRIMLVSVVVLLATMVLLACGAAATTTSGGSGSASTSTSTKKAPAKVGSTITQDNVACTLVSVKPLAPDDFNKPKAGNQFIVVHVKIVNKGSGEINYSPIDFHVKNSAGNITDQEFGVPSSYTDNNELSSAKLAAGGSVEGDIVFQVTAGDHNAALTWQPSFLGNAGDNAWNLGL